jgi:hypothetical protein
MTPKIGAAFIPIIISLSYLMKLVCGGPCAGGRTCRCAVAAYKTHENTCPCELRWRKQSATMTDPENFNFRRSKDGSQSNLVKTILRGGPIRRRQITDSVWRLPGGHDPSAIRQHFPQSHRIIAESADPRIFSPISGQISPRLDKESCMSQVPTEVFRKRNKSWISCKIRRSWRVAKSHMAA